MGKGMSAPASVSEKKYIVLEAVSGFKNLGDESMLAANLRVLKDALGNEYEFIVLSFHPEVTSKIHNFSAKPSFARLRGKGKIGILRGLSLFIRLWWNTQRIKRGKSLKFLNSDEKEFLRIFADCEAFLLVGGGNLNDIYRWGGLFSKGIEVLLAKRLGKPAFLGAQTIGPLNKRWTKSLAKIVLEKADFITLREECSKRVIEELKVKHIKIRVVPDDSFNIDPIGREEALRLLENEGLDVNKARRSGRRLIALNTRPWWRRRGDGLRLKKAVKEILKFLIKEGHFVVFVPTSYGTSPAYDDVNAAKDLLQGTESAQNTRILQGEYDWRQVKGILGLMDLAVGTSYHFAVFAVSMGVPTIGLYQDEYYRLKLRGFFELIGFDELAIDVIKVNNSQLIHVIKKLLNEADQLRADFLSKSNQIRGYSCYAAKRLASSLKG